MKLGTAALALTAAFGAAFATAAEAQNFPSKPIRALVSSSAGGTSDIFMRVLAEELHKRIGQPIIVENRPGGAFNIGARACAEAAPDGYTVCMMSAEPVAFNQFLFKTLPFDPTAFVPITQFFFLTGARCRRNARRSARCTMLPKKARLPDAWSAISRVRNSRRNSAPSTRTGRRNAGRDDIQRSPPGAMPPPGTIIWTCGWWVIAEPQV